MLKLRDYQQAGLDNLRTGFALGHTRQVLVMPTGSGKTEMAAAIAVMAKDRGNHTWFIVDRKVLSAQTKARFESYGLTCSVLQGDNTAYLAGADVTIATIQTLRARLKDRDGLPDFSLFGADLVVIDEVHSFHQFHRDLLDARPELPCVGLSATPHNGSLGLYFTRVVAPVTVKQLIEQDHLVPFRVYQPAQEVDLSGVRFRAGEFVESDLQEKMTAITGDIVTHWIAHAQKRPTIAFCVNVAHAREVAQEFERCGIAAGVVVGGTPDDERLELYEKLRTGRIRVLCSVYVLGVGFDLPEASCAILARPTASEALHIQQCGRVARPAVNKVDALVLDHAGNTLAHGLPQNYVPPALDAVDTRTTKTRNPKERLAIRCGDCGFILEPGQQICPACGIERECSSEVRVIAGRLMEVDAPEPVDDAADPDYRLQMFMEWLSYYESLPKIAKPRGCAAYCYQHYFKILPWEDPAIGRAYSLLRSEPFTLEAKQMAVRYFKQKKLIGRAVAVKESREIAERLQPWDADKLRLLDPLDCGHPYLGVFMGTPPHAAQERCTACHKFIRWIPADELRHKQREAV